MASFTNQKMVKAKKVHFCAPGSNKLTIIIHHLRYRSTPQQVCGDKSATARGIGTDNPHFCLIAQMRHRRLRGFRTRALRRRRNWSQMISSINSTNMEKLLMGFARLKWQGKKQTCQKCKRCLEMNKCTNSTEIMVFFNIGWCVQCRRNWCNGTIGGPLGAHMPRSANINIITNKINISNVNFI